MGLLGRFGSDQKGGVALLFGLALIPLIGVVGAAIDYSRATLAQTKMQNAVDSAALAIVKLPLDASQATIDRVAKSSVEVVFETTVGARSTSGVLVLAPTVTRDGKKVNVAGKGSIDMTLMSILGQGPAEIGAKSVALWSSKKIELALVLDNTGSMNESIGGGTKLEALKSSAKQLLVDLRASAKEVDTIKVAVVPFSNVVKLDPSTYRFQPWFRWSNPSTDPAAWTGLIKERYNSYQFSVAAPSAGTVDSLYTPKMVEKAPRLAAIKPLVSLYNFSDYDGVVKSVEAMQGQGTTNVGLGAMWGVAALSPNAPFAGPAAFGGEVEKYMVVLTDGSNTRGSANGGPVTDVSKLDAATTSACTAAKAAGVKIYTIRLKAGNEALLQSCASKASMYFNVQDAGSLSQAFKDIVDAISGTRLAS